MAGTPAAAERVTPWELAHATAHAAGVELRPIERVDEAAHIRALIRSTWGGQDLPPETIRALAHSGNRAWAAFDGAACVAFVLGWAGVDADGLHVHSHMLATAPSHRGRGIGAALKFAQRAQALDQDIHVVRWTFDPMVTRNAVFNLERLGAVADRFHRHFYGDMGDAMNVGQRSDRLVARWDLDRAPGPRGLAAGARIVPVTADYAAVRATDAEAAAAVREEVASGIEAALADGLVAAGFDAATSAYRFAPPGSLR